MQQDTGPVSQKGVFGTSDFTDPVHPLSPSTIRQQRSKDWQVPNTGDDTAYPGAGSPFPLCAREKKPGPWADHPTVWPWANHVPSLSSPSKGTCPLSGSQEALTPELSYMAGLCT